MWLLPTSANGKYILVKFFNLLDIHEMYFMVSFIKQLFDSVDSHSIIDFIKLFYN